MRTLLLILLMMPFAANADTIWLTHNDGTSIGTVDSTTGAGTDVGAQGFSQSWAAAFGTDGTLFTTVSGFSGNALLATVDQSTGAATTIGSGLGTSLISLEVSSTGQMYGVGYNDQLLYSIDSATGTATAIGSTGISFMMDLAFDSSGALWGTTGNNLWTIDPLTGSSTFVTSISGATAVMSLMFDSTDTMLISEYISGAGLYSVDTSTGIASLIGSTGFNRAHGGDIYTASVPEPGTLALLGIGLAGIGLARRRRKA